MKFSILTVFFASAFCAASLATSKTPPNIIFFIADDISQTDLGCYGHPTIQTPHIDKLASNGMRFDNAYLTISSCSPSRCSIITGRYPHNTGAAELHTELPGGSVLFPKLLKDAGYYSVLSGKHHMGSVADAGFTFVSKGKGPGKEEDWVEILQNRPQDQPFFFWFASSDAHRGWQINDDAPLYSTEDVVVPPYLFDGPKTRDDLASYYHEVSRFDHYIGQTVQELERQGILDNTVIIVMADNGRPFPRAKTRLYDSGIKTPFIVHYPPTVQPSVTDSLISSIDVSATLLDMANVEKDNRIQGLTIAPILRDPNAIVRDVVFAEHNWHVFRNHERMVRTGDWLYIRNNIPDQQNLCVEATAGGSGEELWNAYRSGTLNEAQKGLFWNPCPEEELYHVGKDPDQLKNLSSNPENEAILKQMRQLLQSWSQETGDSLPAIAALTPDRNARPGQTKPKSDTQPRRRVDYGEMPGNSSNAQSINAPGPLRF